MSAPLVLLIEDDPDDTHRIREVLSEGGSSIQLHAVTTDRADAHLRGLDAPASHRPTLILLSLRSPGSDHHLLRAIRTSPTLRSTPVIVLARSPMIAVARDSYDLQASSCVLKPTSDSDFRRAIRAIRRFWLELALLPQPHVSC